MKCKIIKDGILRYDGDDGIIEIPNTITELYGLSLSYDRIKKIKKIIFPPNITKIRSNVFDGGFSYNKDLEFIVDEGSSTEKTLKRYWFWRFCKKQIAKKEKIKEITETGIEGLLTSYSEEFNLQAKVKKEGSTFQFIIENSNKIFTFYLYSEKSTKALREIKKTLSELKNDIITVEKLYDFAKKRELSVSWSIFNDSTDNEFYISSFDIDGYSSFKKIYLNPKIKKIESKAFYRCNLEAIEIPDNVVEICESAFYQSEIKEIKIPNTVIKFGDSIFAECKQLKKVTLPNNMQVIKKWMFRDCISLEEINIPDSVTKIEFRAFSNCKHISESNIPSRIVDVDESAFISTKIKNFNANSFVIKDGLSLSKDGKKLFGITDSSLKELVIPSSVTTICQNAFVYLNLQKLVIPKSVKKIEGLAFVNDFPKEEFIFRGTKEQFEKINKCFNVDSCNITFIP